MQNPYEEFEACFRDEQFDKALEILNVMEGVQALPPHILTRKGIAILLGRDSGGMKLEDAEQAYRDAITLDDEYIDGYLELGYFYLNIQNDADRAMPLFAKAIELCKKTGTQAVSGLAHCVEELKSPTDALQFLDENASMDLDQESISKTIGEIQRLMPDE